jgi:hypothetical protein
LAVIFFTQALLLEYSAEQQQLRDKQKMLKSDWEKFKQQRQQMGSRSVSSILRSCHQLLLTVAAAVVHKITFLLIGCFLENILEEIWSWTNCLQIRRKYEECFRSVSCILRSCHQLILSAAAAIVHKITFLLIGCFYR